MTKTQQSIGKENAIALFDSGWWKTKTHREIAELQFTIQELCCPFDVFHEAMEKTLGRPVWTHEFALNQDGLRDELFNGANPPSMGEIITMLKGKHVFVI
jgi:hypothetical protein